MRVADRAFPPVVAHPLPAGKPIRPVIAIEPTVIPWTWDDPALVWGDPTLVWDGGPPTGPWRDAFCDFQGFTLETGNPDDHGLFDADRLVLSIDNASGDWSQYTVDGTLVEFGPGRHIAVWATNGVDNWWLFYGRVARWDERFDDVVEVEAFDAFSDLAQPIGTYTPGVADQFPGPRITAILAAAGYTDRTSIEQGAVHLTAQSSELAPLEEMQIVSGSDGGVVFCDADGTVVYRGRGFRGGRADQVAIPVLSDNVCTAPIIVWDPTLSTNDRLLADRVILENVAGLKATAVAARPVGAYVYAQSDQQWTTQAEGDTLAAALLARLSPARFALDTITLYLFDPNQPELWRAVDWRLGDRLRYLHDAPVLGGTGRLDVILIAETIEHDVTPDAWTMTAGTTRATEYIAGALWDLTLLTWGDPAALWGY